MSERTVVVIDDDHELRVLVAIRLRRLGLQVVGEGRTGDDAVAFAEAMQPALLVLDHLMPGQRGLDAVPAVRVASPTTRIVMFSAAPDLHLEDERLLPDAIVQKDAGVSALISAVARALESPSPTVLPAP